ncbi:MAG: sugar ABC transporter ATP-binding protein [Planctomycetaceae bacterium]|nr:sugar ABC transporter ATP-binding protein [Planctomycetaceae bacterium]
MDFLLAERVSKHFAGVKALTDVTVGFRKGEVHALLGENGAGKSTLMKIFAGVQPPTSGKLYLDGREVQFGGTADAIRQGICLIYQELSIAPHMTVAENIFMGQNIGSFGLVNRRLMNDRAQAILDDLGAPFSPKTLAGDLSLAEQQQIEIARALSRNSRVLIMDEPTASLSDKEIQQLFQVVKRLKSQGILIIFISHRLDEVLQIADRASVLRDGAYIGTLEEGEIDQNRIVSMMVGRDLGDYFMHESSVDVQPGYFAVKNLGDGHFVRDVSFSVGRGEILGIAGLVGAGRSEMARLIFGVDRKRQGTIALGGSDITINNPRAAIRNRIGFVPEDRKGQGLFLEMASADNIAMNVLPEISSFGYLSGKSTSNYSRRFIQSMSIRVATPRTNASSLSGGNQQKLLLARWISIRPNVLILDEPTRGVDVGSKSEIYQLIGHLSKDGVAVIFISSELPEVIGMAQRVLVMRNGGIVTEIRDKADMTEENILSYASGVTRADYEPDFAGVSANG